jgi:hypothetical protein
VTFSTRIHPADEMHRFELAAPHRTAKVAVTPVTSRHLLAWGFTRSRLEV